jgi:hypothetical protein
MQAEIWFEDRDGGISKLHDMIISGADQSSVRPVSNPDGRVNHD